MNLGAFLIIDDEVDRDTRLVRSHGLGYVTAVADVVARGTWYWVFGDLHHVLPAFPVPETDRNSVLQRGYRIFHDGLCAAICEGRLPFATLTDNGH